MSDKHQPVEYGNIQVCSISLHWTDRIRFIGLPMDVIHSMRTVITSTWGPMQKEEEYHGTHEFKLTAHPWYGQSEDPVGSGRLLVAILRTMAHFGWNLLQAADISKNGADKDNIFFEKASADPNANLFAMSFSFGDVLRIIDAPSFAAPQVKSAIQMHWNKGIQKERDCNGSLEIKFSGNPWHPEGSESVYGSKIICQIIANFREKGYKVYGCVNTVTNKKGADLATWIFRRVGQAWQ